MENINLTVGKLKELIEDLPDDMLVITTNRYDETDCNTVSGFFINRTVGILHNDYEDFDALCIAPSRDGADISTLVGHSDTTCVKVLF